MVGDFLRKAKDALLGDESLDPDNQQPRPASEDPYGDPANQPGGGAFGDVRPASEDPYGDPANQYADTGAFGNVRPASEDPYGDPANQPGGGAFGDVRPASEDPYGDPADEDQNRY
jgi:hypothetical protein